MQSSDAYVEQIAPGARPPTLRPPAVRVVPPRGAEPLPAPAGLYLQVASVRTQEEAAKAGLDVVARSGGAPPPFIRGVAVKVGAEDRIRMFAGPFPDEAAARAYCGQIITGAPCLLRTLPAAPPPARDR